MPTTPNPQTDSDSSPVCPWCGGDPEYHARFDFATCTLRCCCFEYAGDNPDCPVHGEKVEQ